MFRLHHGRFEEAGAQVLGISCDSQHSHRVFASSLGNLPYPLLADFHPHGKMTQAYGLFNDERGTPNRAVVVVDKGGIIRFKKEYPPGTIPDPLDILAEVKKLG